MNFLENTHTHLKLIWPLSWGIFWNILNCNKIVLCSPVIFYSWKKIMIKNSLGSHFLSHETCQKFGDELKCTFLFQIQSWLLSSTTLMSFQTPLPIPSFQEEMQLSYSSSSLFLPFSLSFFFFPETNPLSHIIWYLLLAFTNIKRTAICLISCRWTWAKKWHWQSGTKQWCAKDLASCSVEKNDICYNCTKNKLCTKCLPQ